MNAIDLQIQSTASDGKETPGDLVRLAKEQGLKVISITDHDTVAGVDEALEAARKYAVRVIPGIEMSAEEHESHILGYGIDHKHPRLLDEVRRMQEERIRVNREMMENLRKNEGFAIEWDDVLSDTPGSTVTSFHVVRAIMKKPENKEKLGGISKNEFYRKYLSRDGPNRVARKNIPAKSAIDILHTAGGVAVWSHPAIAFREDQDNLEKFLLEMIQWGIDGIEVFNPSHTEDDVEFLESMSVKYRLLRTAGSDFHDRGNEKNHPRDPATGLHSADTVGDYETYGFSTDGIIEKLDAAIAARR